ncbi:phage virion morphogenesis protein [Stenotrophomonas rhizophila]
MSEDLQQLETWAAPLLRQLQPAQRNKLSRSVGTALRRSQQKRITTQRNPDGTAYAPRRPAAPARAKAGRIKRKAMFGRIKQAKHLRARGTAREATVGFLGRVSRIARIHQEGRSDRVAPDGPRITYARRELLGFTAADEQLVRDLLMDHLTGQ